LNEGIPYFSFDVHLDDKFELIEAEYGLKGFAVVVKVLQKIYGENGYYCEWTKDVELLFSKKIGFLDGGNSVSEIIRSAIKRSIFNEELFNKYSILTSTGVQKRYFKAVERRKEVEVDKRYLLLDHIFFSKNANISFKNVNINEENDNIFEQRKVKERKENDNMTVGISHDNIFHYVEQFFGILSPLLFQR